jgi:hypothetical protein
MFTSYKSAIGNHPEENALMTMVARPETVDNRHRAKAETWCARLIVERQPISVRSIQQKIRGRLRASEIREIIATIEREKPK